MRRPDAVLLIDPCRISGAASGHRAVGRMPRDKHTRVGVDCHGEKWRGARGDRECCGISTYARGRFPGPAMYPVPSHPYTRTLALHRHAVPRPCTPPLGSVAAPSSSSIQLVIEMSTELAVPPRAQKKNDSKYTVAISRNICYL